MLEDEIQFVYAPTFFIAVAALFGLFGGLIRQVAATKKRWDVKQFAINGVLGVVCGALAYILAPLIVTLTFKPEQLKDASKLFEAIAWGFVGGGSGPALLGRLFSSKSGSA